MMGLNLENFILIVLAIFIGYSLKRLKIFPKEAPVVLNSFVIYISLPAMILLQIPKLHFSMEMFIPIITAWLVMSLTAVFTLYISKFLNFSKEVTGCLMLVAILGNTSFLGIPIVNAYLGNEAMPYVLVYDQIGTFIALATYGTFIASYYSSKSELNFKVILHKVLTFPPFISLVISLFLIGSEFPVVLTNILTTLSNTIIPIALVAVGLQLQLKLQKDEIKPFSIALLIKLVLAPILAVIISFTFGWSSLASLVSILESAMAPMITAGAIASMAGLAPRLSSAIVGYGIILSFLSTGVLFKLIY